MSKTKTVSCPVDTGGDFGVYANAFRVLSDGPDAVLDFCLYSEAEGVAKTVSRVRVSPSFLQVILARLGSAVRVETDVYLLPEIEGMN